MPRTIDSVDSGRCPAFSAVLDRRNSWPIATSSPMRKRNCRSSRWIRASHRAKSATGPAARKGMVRATSHIEANGLCASLSRVNRHQFRSRGGDARDRPYHAKERSWFQSPLRPNASPPIRRRDDIPAACFGRRKTRAAYYPRTALASAQRGGPIRRQPPAGARRSALVTPRGFAPGEAPIAADGSWLASRAAVRRLKSHL